MTNKIKLNELKIFLIFSFILFIVYKNKIKTAGILRNQTISDIEVNVFRYQEVIGVYLPKFRILYCYGKKDPRYSSNYIVIPCSDRHFYCVNLNKYHY